MIHALSNREVKEACRQEVLTAIDEIGGGGASNLFLELNMSGM